MDITVVKYWLKRILPMSVTDNRVFSILATAVVFSSARAELYMSVVHIQSCKPNILYILLVVPIENARSLPVLLVQALSSSSTPSAGSPWMKWRSSRGSRWRRTCARPARSWRARWRTLTMSTRPTCSDKASDVVRFKINGLQVFVIIFSAIYHDKI